MNILIGTILIGSAALWLWRMLPNAQWRQAAYRASLGTMAFTVPRILVALLGAGFFAELLPAEHVQQFLGEDAGSRAIGIAFLAGALTPGGAFVSFAIGAAALKAGAAMVPVLCYVVSWSLFSLVKIIAYELPLMGREIAMTRIILSLPVPFVVAGLAMLVLG